MAEAGPGGRVASADRVRRGGIGGFFAREHFEVTVEYDEADGEAAPSAQTTTVQRESARVSTVVDGTPLAAPASPPATPNAESAGQSWSELADGTQDVLELSSSPSVPAVQAIDSPTAHLPSTQKASFASLLAAIAHDTVDESGDVPTAAVVSAVAPAPIIEPDRDMVADDMVAADIVAADIVAADLLAPEPPVAPIQHSAAPPTAVPVAHPHGELAAAIAPGLGALGLPDELVPDAAVVSALEALSEGEDARAYIQLALTRSLARLPEAAELSLRPGSIIVIVGELEKASDFAGHLAERAGMAQDEVVVASRAKHRTGVAARSLVSTAEDVKQLLARARRSKSPTIIAMHAPVSACPGVWAERMLSALSPTAVWGIAGATHKAEDLAAWAEGLGGLDALAVDELSSTVSPAQVLASGIPVASIEGQRATAALWAALIASRLLLQLVVTDASAPMDARS
jgi:hypothetical protein